MSKYTSAKKVLSSTTLSFAFVISLFIFSFSSKAEEMRKITLEDIDASKDGFVSSDEAQIYLKKMNDDYTQKLEMQKLEIERRENDLKQNKSIKYKDFHPADIDRNGVISPDEYAVYFGNTKTKEFVTEKNKNSWAIENDEQKIPKFLQKTYERRTEEMKNLDENGDGILQSNELQNNAQVKFDAADTNKDGQLSQYETKAAISKANGDKRVIGPDANRMKNRLQNADADKDGKLSKEEYGAYMNNHQRNFDRNGDGVISKEEYRMDSEKLPKSYRKTPYGGF